MARWSGTYFDGETARPHRVEIEIGSDELGIFGRGIMRVCAGFPARPVKPV